MQDEELLQYVLSQLAESNRRILLRAIGTNLIKRFERMDLIDDLDRAITMREKAVLLTPVGHSDRAGYLNNLGVALPRRSERTGSTDDLHHAIAILIIRCISTI